MNARHNPNAAAVDELVALFAAHRPTCTIEDLDAILEHADRLTDIDSRQIEEAVVEEMATHGRPGLRVMQHTVREALIELCHHRPEHRRQIVQAARAKVMADHAKRTRIAAELQDLGGPFATLLAAQPIKVRALFEILSKVESIADDDLPLTWHGPLTEAFFTGTESVERLAAESPNDPDAVLLSRMLELIEAL